MNRLTRPGDTAWYPIITSDIDPWEDVMTVEILRDQSAVRIDHNLQVVVLLSLLGLMLGLAVLPFLGSDLATFAMLAD